MVLVAESKELVTVDSDATQNPEADCFGVFLFSCGSSPLSDTGLKFLVDRMHLMTVVDFPSTVRKTFEKQSAVMFGEYTRVQDHNTPGIRPMSDQPAKTLFQSDHRFRHLVVTKRISPLLPNAFQTSFKQRMIGHTKGKSRNNDVLQSVPRHIHSLPEAVSPEQHRPLVRSESLQHRGPRQSLPLAVETDVL